MLIVYGVQRKDTRMGYVADFCPICRELRAFAIMKVGLAEHVQGFSPGQGRTIGFLKICQTCGILMPGDPGKFANIPPKLIPKMADLIRDTNPDILADEAERLGLAERIHNSPTDLPESVRAALTAEPFELIAFHAKTIQKHTSNRPALAILAAFVLPFVVVFATIPFPKISTIAMLSTFVGCLAYAVWSGMDDLFLKNSRKPRELLTRSIQPLKVTRDEVAAAMSTPLVRELALWKRLSPEKVMSWLAADMRKTTSSKREPRQPVST